MDGALRWSFEHRDNGRSDAPAYYTLWKCIGNHLNLAASLRCIPIVHNMQYSKSYLKPSVTPADNYYRSNNFETVIPIQTCQVHLYDRKLISERAIVALYY